MGAHSVIRTTTAQDGRDAEMPIAVAYLRVSGMACPTCEERIRAALLRLNGVALAEVRLSSELAGVLYDPQQVTPSELVAAVKAAGNDGVHKYRGQLLPLLMGVSRLSYASAQDALTPACAPVPSLASA